MYSSACNKIKLRNFLDLILISTLSVVQKLVLSGPCRFYKEIVFEGDLFYCANMINFNFKKFCTCLHYNYVYFTGSRGLLKNIYWSLYFV